MKNTYFDLIKQSFDFPQNGFSLEQNELCFHGISIKQLIKKYGTPFRLFYLPKIGHQINKARLIFNAAIAKFDYKGKYHYCYCTKSNHFSHVVRETLKHDVHLETSSSFDIDLINNFHKNGRINKQTHIINNGFKTDEYLKKIIELQKSGFDNTIIVLDSKDELRRLLNIATGKMQVSWDMRKDARIKGKRETIMLGKIEFQMILLCDILFQVQV